MALELPLLIQRLVLDSSGFKRGAEEAEASFRKAANASENAAEDVASSAQRNYTKAAAAAAEAADKTNKSWAKVADGASDVGKKMATFITLPLIGVAAAAVKTAGEFESTLNQMAAVAGVPGPELKKLGALAKQMGADTVFSANDAAGAMLNLSKAGISTSDIMGGAVQATLSLAAAGGLDLATAATVAGNAMNTFGLEGKDAALISDALAGAANASSADVSDLAMALAQGGLAAHAAGLSIQETTAVLAAFADAGLRGSDAGTSLKTFMLNLVPSSKPAREAMADLGLKFTDINGAMLPLPVIAQRLQDATKNLSDEQRTLALQTIFGTDAYRAALIISEQGAAGLENYTRATSEQGTAAKVADARMQGWAGTWEQFKGSLETAALSIGQVVIPAITPLVDKVKDLADGFSALDPEQAKFAVRLGAIAAAAGPALFILGKLGGLAATTAGGISSLGTGMAGAAANGGAFSGVLGSVGTALAGVGAGTVVAAVAALAALGVAFVVAYKKSEAFRDIVNGAWEKVSGFFKSVWEGQLQPIFKDFMRIVDAMKPVLIGLAAIFAVSFVAPLVAGALVLKGGLEIVSLAFQVMAAVVETVGRNLSPIFGGIQKAASAVWQAMQVAWDGITTAVNALWRVMQAAWDGITTAVNTAWQAVNPVWQAMQAAWDVLTAAANGLWHVIQAVWDGITTVVVGAWHVIGAAWREMVSYVSDVLGPVFKLWQAIAIDVWEFIRGGIEVAWNIIKALWDALVWAVKNLLIPTLEGLRDAAVAVWNAIVTVIKWAWEEVVKPLWDAIKWAIDNLLIPAFNLLRDGVSAVWDAISSVIEFAWNSVIKPVWDAIKWAIDNALVPAFNFMSDTASTVWDTIGSVISGAWNNVVKPIWEAIKGFIEGPLTTVFNTFKDTVSTVWDVFTGAARTAWDTVKGIIGGALRGIGNLVSGFLRVVANIADVVGLDHIAGVLREGADAANGWGQGLAAGGAMGSPAAVGGGFVTSGPQAVVGEGNPMFPEFVIPTDPKYRGRATSLMLEAQERMFPRHAAGTNRLGTTGGGARERAAGMFTGGDSWLEKVVNIGGDVLESVGDAVLSAASWTIDQVRKLGRAGLEKAWPKLPVPDNIGGIAPAGINSVRQGVLDLIWNKVPPPSEGGGGGGGVPYDGSGQIGSGWEQITGYLDSVGQGYQVTSTTGGTHAPGSLHYAGKAVDLVGDMAAIFNTLGAGGPVPGINELFFDPMGYFYDEGVRQSGAIGGHDDHVHAATFDKGGILHPGRNMLINNTGGPEALARVPMAFGGILPGPNPWENPFFNPGAWVARNVDEFASGVPSPDAPTPQDLSDAPMFNSPANSPHMTTNSVVISDNAFPMVFHGAVTPEVQAQFTRQLNDAIRQIIQALRMGAR